MSAEPIPIPRAVRPGTYEKYTRKEPMGWKERRNVFEGRLVDIKRVIQQVADRYDLTPRDLTPKSADTYVKLIEPLLNPDFIVNMV